MIMDEKLIRNIPAISESEQELISSKRVFIAGCGGLGGYAVEYLARLGILQFTVLDCDSFEESNINRQLLAELTTLGKSKAETAKGRILSISPAADVTALTEKLTSENAADMISGHDLVIDALDSVESRLVLENACTELGITMIHGAVHGWSFEAAVVSPGSGLIKRLYANSVKSESKTILSFVPPCCAAVQASEALLFLLGRQSGLGGKVLFFDMETMENTLISI